MVKQERHRIFGLDVIRASAILLVVASHWAALVLPKTNGVIMPLFHFAGAVGVDLFFVLSGFLIGGLLLKNIQNQKTRFFDICYFWVRRWFRTLPNYVLILILNIIIFYLLFDIADFRVLYYFLFLQNFADPHPRFFTEAWSLSIEEYAYLLGPILLLVLVHLFRLKRHKALFLWMTFLVIGLITFNRYCFYLEHDVMGYNDWTRQMRNVVIYRIDSIYFGFLAVYVSKYYEALWRRFKWTAFAFGSFLFFGMHLTTWYFHIQPQNSLLFYALFYLPLLYISLVFLLPVFSLWKRGGFLSSTITRLSKISYSLYLVNMSLVFIPLRYVFDVDSANLVMKIVISILFWGLSIAVANALYNYYETPLMAFRNHKRILKLLKQESFENSSET
ncbi:acyltransferase [Sediminibacter sp. Hel_I_10]|uniref:acyltransferase family protein n=1 Tax=Sediminibacter sp. Hel_I_10 TaxID=1392490 RepID=UPI00047B613C|nr:acyltransferase [Sediminibacter sp. Hel_I_10]